MKLLRPSVIQIGFKKKVADVAGNSVRKRIIEDLKIAGVEAIRTIDVYTIDKALSKAQLIVIKRELTDPVIQISSLNKPLARAGDFDWLVEVGYKPGVTDNVGKTAMEAIEDMLGVKFQDGEAVYTSRQYLFKGELSREEIVRICRDLLANELIERWTIFNSREWSSKVIPNIPRVSEEHAPKVNFIDLAVSDEALLEISRRRLLALSLEEMKAIASYFKRPDVIEERKKVGLSDKPTDVEIEALAQTWSEHCKHKIFNALIRYQDENGNQITIDSLFKTYIKGATDRIAQKVDFLVSVFKDNAGVIKFNENYNLVLKVETHNAPSALDPYGGALTGIVGVNRDPMGTGKGAKLIFNTNVFCFASPFYSHPLPPRVLHPKRIFEGVRRGVEHGGNKSGIPTVNGTIYFDDRFLCRPLVYCGTAGIMPSIINNEPSHIKKIRDGDLIVMTGGRIGKDGIHGATFSSEELHEQSPTSAVQIGDPITQKKMYDFLLEARDLGLYSAITDNGAGGLSSSVGEMAQLSGGCELHLDRAPLKYAGLDPWEILLSESQERMTLSVPLEKIDEFLELARKRGVEATVLGKFTTSGKFHVLYKGRTVAYLDMDFLHNGVPQMKLEAVFSSIKREDPELPFPENLTEVLKKMLSRLNICSKEYVIRQYDHEVQGGSVIKPLVGIANDGPSDAAVVRPLLDSLEGVVIANGINPRYGDIDTYHMAACAIDEAIRNAIAVGANLDHIALNDNFCWPSPIYDPEKNPDGKYKLAQLVRANMALYDYTVAYNTPCISGKDSMSIDYKYRDEKGVEHKISGPPTLLITAIGKIKDVRKAVTMDVKAPGDLVYILGITRSELGGSEYYAMFGYIGNSVPKVEAEAARELYRALNRAMECELIESCHDVSNGGLAIALAESAFAGGFGMEIDLRKVPVEGVERDDYILFSESQSRFIVTVAPMNQGEFERIMKGNVYACIGKVCEGEEFKVIGVNGEVIICANIRDLKEAWQSTLRW